MDNKPIKRLNCLSTIRLCTPMIKMLSVTLFIFSCSCFAEEKNNDCKILFKVVPEHSYAYIYGSNPKCIFTSREISLYIESTFTKEVTIPIDTLIVSGGNVFRYCLEHNVPDYGAWPVNISDDGFFAVRKHASELVHESCAIPSFFTLTDMKPASVDLEKEIFIDRKTGKEYSWGDNYKGLPGTAYLSNAVIRVRFK